jgi:hypothetical protein
MIKILNQIQSKLYKRLQSVRHLYIFIFTTITMILLVFITKYSVTIDRFSEIDHNKKIIYFGQTCDLQNNVVSIDYSIGFQLAFQHINRQGVIDGYKLNIILLNDRYETDLAVNNAKLLIDYYNVLSIIGTFGTPTTVGIFNEAIKERHISLIAPFTAGTSYRTIFNKYRIYMNTDFYVEFDLLLESLLENKFKNISVIYQNDIYGNFFYTALVDYLFKHNVKINIISSGHYERNSDDLDESIKSIFNIDTAYDFDKYKSEHTDLIEAVVLFTAEKEISSYLGGLKRIKPEVAIYYNFFTGTRETNLEYLEENNTDNIYQSNLTLPIDNYPLLKGVLADEVQSHNEHAQIKISEINSTLVQGFYSGLMIGEVLRNFKNISEVNRESFTDMFYKMRMIDVYDVEIGPFILNVNSEGIRHGELNQLMPNLEFKTIKIINKPVVDTKS